MKQEPGSASHMLYSYCHVLTVWHGCIAAVTEASGMFPSPAQVDQLGDDEGAGEDDMEAVPVEDEHGNISVVRRKRLVFGQIK